jgi:AraC-like DNA-binding protein
MQHGITLTKVFDFIEGNYQDPIGLFEVAQFVGYSPAYLTDLVRRQTGRPVHDWIIERRMTEACRLLQETNDSASRIAEVTGYQTTGYFFRQFRQRYGTTPQAWRTAQRKMHHQNLIA